MPDPYAAPPYHLTNEGRRIAVHALDEGREKTLAVGWLMPFREDETRATFRLFAKAPDVIAAGRRLLDYLHSLGLAHQPAAIAFAEAIADATAAPQEAAK